MSLSLLISDLMEQRSPYQVSQLYSYLCGGIQSPGLNITFLKGVYDKQLEINRKKDEESKCS